MKNIFLILIMACGIMSINAMIKEKSDEQCRKDRALIETVQSGYLPEVERLLNEGADKNANNSFGYSSLYYAVLLGHDEVVKFLIKQGADLKYLASRGYSDLLHVAVENGRVNVVQTLLQAGVLIDGKDYDQKETALHRAVLCRSIDMINLLLANGANIEAKDKADRTPLHTAVVKGYVGIAELLLKAGANIEAADCAGYRSLHLAASRGHLAVIKLLLDRHADKTCRTLDGLNWTPAEIAEATFEMQKGAVFMEIYNLLK